MGKKAKVQAGRNNETYRVRLIEEREKILGSIGRNRMAEADIDLETADEGDLANASHSKELLMSLQETGHLRLQAIKHALKRIDSGEYGECVRVR